VSRLVSKILDKSSTGLARMKGVVNRGLEMNLREAIALEVEIFLDYFPADDPLEGLTVFSEKRRPRFR